MPTAQEQSVAFTGNRDLKHPAVKNALKLRALIEVSLREKVVEQYRLGRTTFLSGMAVGFDLMAARVVLDMRRELPLLRLVAVVPFEGHDRYFSPEDRELSLRVMDQADECVVLASSYSPEVFHKRNDYLIERSSHLVAYSSGEGKGTLYTIKRGLSSGLSVDNIFVDMLPPHTLGRLF